jgi:predicted MFS family arabinose efflux permease
VQEDVRKVLPDLLCLATGVFAVATEGFMIAGLLLVISQDLHVSLSLAGQLIAAFSLAYAISSPLMSVITANVERRLLLVLAISVFGIGNVCAAWAVDYPTLISCRILLAVAAGVFTPAATALAGRLVAPEMRGRALAWVNMGATLGITLGVSVATFLGQSWGWRSTFAIIGGISFLAAITIFARLPISPASSGGSTISQRIAVAQTPGVMPSLLATMLWSGGVYTLFTYVAPLMDTIGGIPDRHLDIVLFGFGLSSVAGAYVGGFATDKVGPGLVSLLTLAVLALAYTTVSLIGYSSLSGMFAKVAVLTLMLACGVATWAFYASQQVRLLRLVEQRVGPIVLSLNSSFMYLGFAAGAALGALAMALGGVKALGWTGALCEVAAGSALWLSHASRRRSVSPTLV